MKTSLSVIQEFGNLCINHLLTTVIHWAWHWQWQLSQIEIMPLSWMPVSSWASSSWLQGAQSQGLSHSFLMCLNCWTFCWALRGFHRVYNLYGISCILMNDFLMLALIVEWCWTKDFYSLWARFGYPFFSKLNLFYVYGRMSVHSWRRP